MLGGVDYVCGRADAAGPQETSRPWLTNWEGPMELSDRGRIKNAPDLTVTRPKTGASARFKPHERWLVEVGFAVRRDGRLLPTADGRAVGAALFGYIR